MKSDQEEIITPLKRHKKKKRKANSTISIQNNRQIPSINKEQLTPTKKNIIQSSPTKSSPAKSSPIKASPENASQTKVSPFKLSKVTVNNDEQSFKGVFCSSNNKPDMMFFKPRINEQDASTEKLIYCPICCINLQFLHGTTSQLHINKCLDRQPDFEQGYCSGDSSCSLSNVNHFRKYKHREKLKSTTKMTTKSNSEGDNVEALEDDIVDVVEVNSSQEKPPSPKDSFPSPSITKSPKKQSCINDFFGGKKPSIKPNNLFGNKKGNSSQITSKVKTARPIKNARKECPFYKKIPGTNFTVDAFRYGDIEGCTCYFLTHYHSDHYGGLKKSFEHKLYCSQITANLVMSQINVSSQFIHVLPMNEVTVVEGVKIIPLDANHCPGAVMFLMELPSLKRILHVGDFRAHPSMLQKPPLTPNSIDTLYLDTTYCNPKHKFPSQEQVVDFAVKIARRHLKENPKTLIICGTYTIGKEKVFQAIAEDLDIKIAVYANKMNVLRCLCDEDLNKRLTQNFDGAGLHVVPMNRLTIKSLQDHLLNHMKTRGWERVLAFKPTGWTYSDKLGSLDDIQPIRRPDVSIFGVPYSEHSSFEELKTFVTELKPKKIISTVNVGRKDSRDEMNRYFAEWLGKN